ncbi:MAG: hypothetical protein V4649_02815 [Bacteroidota bacterium]
MLNQITLACYEQVSNHQFINAQTWCVAELYCSFLKRYKTGKIVKCNVSIKDNWNELIDYYERYTDVITVRLNFDFDAYLKLSKLEMKRMQLNHLHKGMMVIAQQEGWSVDQLLDAYNYSLRQNLLYSFYLRNNRWKSSPDRAYKIRFWCEWDIDSFDVYYVLFDRQNQELKRSRFIKGNPSEGEFIYYVDWKWIDNKTVLFSNNYKYGNGEVWTIEVV